MQTTEKTVPDELLERARALFDEARSAKENKDLAVARSTSSEAIDALLSGGDETNVDARTKLLSELGTFAHAAGDLQAAKRARERVLEVRTRNLPKDHPELQTARENVAATRYALGDLAGAQALFETVFEVRSRTLPDDDPELQKARLNLALVFEDLGDLQGARALEEKVLEVRSRLLSDDDPDLQAARQNLAVTMSVLGDLAGARRLFEKVLDVLSRTLPDDHPELQAARQNVAVTIEALGDLAGARALFVKVLEVDSRTLPEDHPDLQRARLNVALAIKALGDLAGARVLEEKVVEVFSRTLPDDHPDLQVARQNLAVTIESLGDIAGARPLFEKVLENFSRRLPEDHPDLQRARQNLAVTLEALGDLAGARAIEEQVLDVRSRTLPDDHPDLQLARLNLALTIEALGELADARALEEKVLEVFSRTLPDHHPDLQRARGHLANTMADLGDLAGARALEEKVLEVFVRTLPDSHPDLQWARQNLAGTLKALGDLAGARALEERVLQVRSATLPDDHPDLQWARESLACTVAAQCVRPPGGEESERAHETESCRARCADLLLALSRAQTHAVRSVLLSSPTREAEERCARLSEKLDVELSFARGYGVFERSPELEDAAFTLSESARGAAIVSAGLARKAKAAPNYAELRETLVQASDALAALVQQGTTNEAFEAARVRRESAERELISLARNVAGVESAGLDLDASALAQQLTENTASVSFRRFRDARLEVTEGSDAASTSTPREAATDRLCAFVVCSTAAGARTGAPGPLTLVDLGPIDAIERAVRGWRESIGVGAGRGIGAVSARAASRASQAPGDSLRRLVFDPLIAAIGERERIVLVLDDVLNLVAFDALPLDPNAAQLIGDRWKIETRATLGELWNEQPLRDGARSLLAIGGVRYDGDETTRIAAASAGRSAPRTEVAEILRGGPWHEGFPELPETAEEAEGVGAAFTAAIGADAKPTLLERGQATREGLLELAPTVRFLHIATHGWYASESIKSWSDPRPIDVRSGLGLRRSGEQQVKGMSPMLLCGLAFAGSNLPENSAGRAPGLVTADELSALDLSNCELAVLSACDTNVGERRAGQGVASFQRALQMAGARTVITSLWKVPDEATKELMLDFYRRIWVEKAPKGRALWAAKKKLREARDARGSPKYSTRDWAAWILTGDPN